MKKFILSSVAILVSTSTHAILMTAGNVAEDRANYHAEQLARSTPNNQFLVADLEVMKDLSKEERDLYQQKIDRINAQRQSKIASQANNQSQATRQNPFMASSGSYAHDRGNYQAYNTARQYNNNLVIKPDQEVLASMSPEERQFYLRKLDEINNERRNQAQFNSQMSSVQNASGWGISGNQRNVTKQGEQMQSRSNSFGESNPYQQESKRIAEEEMKAREKEVLDTAGDRNPCESLICLITGNIVQECNAPLKRIWRMKPHRVPRYLKGCFSHDSGKINKMSQIGSGAGSESRMSNIVNRIQDPEVKQTVQQSLEQQKDIVPREITDQNAKLSSNIVNVVMSNGNFAVVCDAQHFNTALTGVDQYKTIDGERIYTGLSQDIIKQLMNGGRQSLIEIKKVPIDDDGLRIRYEYYIKMKKNQYPKYCQDMSKHVQMILPIWKEEGEEGACSDRWYKSKEFAQGWYEETNPRNFIQGYPISGGYDNDDRYYQYQKRPINKACWKDNEQAKAIFEAKKAENRLNLTRKYSEISSQIDPSPENMINLNKNLAIENHNIESTDLYRIDTRYPIQYKRY